MNIPPKTIKQQLKAVNENSAGNNTETGSAATPAKKKTGSIEKTAPANIQNHDLPVNISEINSSLDKLRSGSIDPVSNSLPALTAFRDFLSEERRRFQVRLLVLCSMIAAVFLLIIGGLLIFFHQSRKGYEENYRNVTDKYAKISLRNKAAEETLKKFGGDYLKLKKNTRDTIAQLENRTAEIQKSMDQNHTHMKEYKTDIQEHVTVNKGLLDDLSTDLTSLKDENTALKEEITLLKHNISALKETSEKIETKTEKHEEMPQLTAKEISEYEDKNEMILSIKPRDTNTMTNELMDWLIPMP
jgi:hypothetical protein